MNINEITTKYDELIKEQRKTMKTMNNLIIMAEQLLYDIQQYNKGVRIRQCTR